MEGCSGVWRGVVGCGGVWRRVEVSIHTECTHPQPHTSSHTHTSPCGVVSFYGLALRWTKTKQFEINVEKAPRLPFQIPAWVCNTDCQTALTSAKRLFLQTERVLREEEVYLKRKYINYVNAYRNSIYQRHFMTRAKLT